MMMFRPRMGSPVGVENVAAIPRPWDEVHDTECVESPPTVEQILQVFVRMTESKSMEELCSVEMSKGWSRSENGLTSKVREINRKLCKAFPDLTLGLVAMKSMEGLLHPQHRRVSAVEQLLRRTLLLQPLFEDDLNSISSVLESCPFTSSQCQDLQRRQFLLEDQLIDQEYHLRKLQHHCASREAVMEAEAALHETRKLLEEADLERASSFGDEDEELQLVYPEVVLHRSDKSLQRLPSSIVQRLPRSLVLCGLWLPHFLPSYEHLDQIGSHTFKATHQGQCFVLKGFMLSSEASLSAFVNECSVLLSVRHPILVPLSGILLDGTSAYLRMPYNGEITLEEWIRSRCPSNAAKCLALRQILEVGD